MHEKTNLMLSQNFTLSLAQSHSAGRSRFFHTLSFSVPSRLQKNALKKIKKKMTAFFRTSFQYNDIIFKYCYADHHCT